MQMGYSVNSTEPVLCCKYFSREGELVQESLMLVSGHYVLLCILQQLLRGLLCACGEPQ